MLTVHTRPDAITATRYLAMEKKERSDQIAKDTALVLEAKPMGKITVWAPKDHTKPRHLMPHEKFALDGLQGFLALRAADREEHCWMHSLGCARTPHVWVHEVGFDLKDMEAELKFGQVNSLDIGGAVPGFCIFHMAEAPAMLAERVYFTNPAVQFGYLPSRWYIKYTDGTSSRGPIKQINPKMLQPDIMEEHIKSDERH